MRCLLEANSPLNFILDIFKDRRKEPKKKEKDNKYLGGSVSEYTKNLVMTFPTLCDSSLRPETASMISKANERNIVSMLQMLFASMQLKGTNGVEILGKLHKNISTNMSMDDYIDALDNIASKTAGGKLWESAKGQVILRDKINLVLEDAKRPRKSFPVSSFNEKSLMNYVVMKDYRGRSIVKETKINYKDANNSIKYNTLSSKYAPLGDPNYDPQAPHAMDIDTAIKRAQFNQNTIKTAYDVASTANRLAYDYNADQINRARNDREEERELRDIDRAEREKAKELRDIEKAAREKELHDLTVKQQQIRYAKDTGKFLDLNDQIQAIGKQLLDSDIKKANELAPSMMIVKYSELDSDGSIYDQKAFVTGVKSRLIAVDPGDIIERLVAKNKTKISFLNFIRATTGEISFIKDFLLCTKQAKIDAKNSVKKGPEAKMWKALEARSAKNSLNRMRKTGNDASCITTLVINKETANLMKKEFDFDIESPRNAKMIMNSYNLLAIFICDESVESVKSLYAGNDIFETQAYSYLEREDKDKSYKKVINLMGQINR